LQKLVSFTVVLWEKMVLLQFSNASFLLNTLSLHQEAYVVSLEVYLGNVAPKNEGRWKRIFLQAVKQDYKISV